MLIVCPNCATSYDVEAASLRPNGRRVRCVRCRTVWDVELPHAERLLAAAEALAPERPAETVAESAAAAAAAAVTAPAEPFAAAASAKPVGPAIKPAAEPIAAPVAAAAPVPEAAAADDAPVEVESPPIAPAEPGADAPAVEQQDAAPTAPVEDIETIAARRYARHAKPKGWRWPLSHLQSGILALIVVDAIVVGWRADFVRAMPQTAAFYRWIGLPVNMRGLSFDDLTTASEQHEGLPILVVGGNIVNVTGKPEDVPHLRFAVRNAARQELYSWTAAPPRTVLPPGEAIAFHSRLASPPPDAHDVLVRFVNRYDIMTGTH